MVSALDQLGIYTSAGLFAVEHTTTATVFTLVGLGTRTVFPVLDDVATLATMAMTNFYYHSAKINYQLEYSTTRNTSLRYYQIDTNTRTHRGICPIHYPNNHRPDKLTDNDSGQT